MKIKKGFVKRKIQDEYLVVTTGELSKTSGIMIQMNETSSEIWDMIEKGWDAEKIAKKLSEKYELPYDKAKQDTDGLIAQMSEAGIFE